MHYDFRSLNPVDFETLACDLVEATVGIRVERFKAGKDQGIDGRWLIEVGGTAIVQAKHFVDSGYAALVRHLKKVELEKIRKLNPSRYVLITSVPLSPANKQALRALLSPYVVADSDILGPADLNAALGKHSEIEGRHYSLWLKSSHVLKAIQNHALHGRSRSELETIQERAEFFVTTSAHERARAKLGKIGMVVITGEPGVGKTTLAEQLVLESVADGYELVVLVDSVQEGEAVFDDHARQIFLFDDFLGTTYLTTLHGNRDSHILRFLRRVERNGKKRFVLTSRTSIMNRASILSETIASPNVQDSRYELSIGAMSRLDRARMLCSHMWRSRLAASFIEEIYI